MQTRGSLCPRCKTVEVEAFEIAGTVFPALCDDCDADYEAAELERKAEINRQSRQLYIENEIPSLYLDNDERRFPAQWAQIRAWEPSERGLLLVGDTGAGKTRMLCEAVRMLHMRGGIGFRFLRASLLGKLVRQQFGDFEPWVARAAIDRIGKVPILIIDDLGKQASSPVVEEEIYDLIEERTSNRLPILATTNARGDEMESMLSPDRGKPIIRRLREFCEVVVVK